MRDRDTGLVEADITINGVPLTFPQAMALRVAVSSYRMFVREPSNATDIGTRLAEGYDQHLAAVEEALLALK